MGQVWHRAFEIGHVTSEIDPAGHKMHFDELKGLEVLVVKLVVNVKMSRKSKGPAIKS